MKVVVGYGLYLRTTIRAMYELYLFFVSGKDKNACLFPIIVMQIGSITTADGQTKIDVRLEDETLWLTQAQMYEQYQTSYSNVSEHVIWETLFY